MNKRSYRDAFNEAGESNLRGVLGDAGCLSLATYILGRSSPPSCSRVLDLGCGDGAVLKAIARLRPDLDCVGVDFAAKLIERAKRECPPTVSFHVADLAVQLPDGLGLFDRIVSFSVLQYQAPIEIPKMCQRLRENLKVDGRIIHLSIPDLSKRVLMFHDSFLNVCAGRTWAAGKLNLLYLTGMDLKRRISRNRSYGDEGYFHDGEELAALCSEQFVASIQRPSDSWYRFDLLLHPK